MQCVLNPYLQSFFCQLRIGIPGVHAYISRSSEMVHVSELCQVIHLD